MKTLAHPLLRPTLAPLALALALPLAGCGDDDETPETETDTGQADAIGDAGTTDGGDDDTSGEDATVDAPTGTGTLGGSIFNNTGTTEGTLRVALVPADVEGGDPVFELEDDAPLFPYTWGFEDVPLGNYYVVALLDVDEPNDVTDPGPGDLAGRTEDPAGGSEDGFNNTNVNVEIR